MSVWLRVADAARQPPLRLAVEGKLDGRDYYRFAAVGQSPGREQPAASPVDRDWGQYIFQVDDLPLEGLSQLRVRFDLMGQGEVWVDDVQLYDLAFSETELRGLAEADHPGQRDAAERPGGRLHAICWTATGRGSWRRTCRCKRRRRRRPCWPRGPRIAPPRSRPHPGPGRACWIASGTCCRNGCGDGGAARQDSCVTTRTAPWAFQSQHARHAQLRSYCLAPAMLDKARTAGDNAGSCLATVGADPRFAARIGRLWNEGGLS